MHEQASARSAHASSSAIAATTTKASLDDQTCAHRILTSTISDDAGRVMISRALGPLLRANVEARDQFVLDAKHVADHFVTQQGAVEIAYDGMDLDDDFTVGTD